MFLCEIICEIYFGICQFPCGIAKHSKHTGILLKFAFNYSEFLPEMLIRRSTSAKHNIVNLITFVPLVSYLLLEASEMIPFTPSVVSGD